MIPTVTLTLPYPPSVNTYWRANGHRRFISKAGREFTEEVYAIVKNQRHEGFEDKRIGLSIVINPRSKRRFDLDNTLKAILDALMKAGMYDDDEQIDYIEIVRGEQVDGGSAVVDIYENL